jgi:hypothetical protein
VLNLRGPPTHIPNNDIQDGLEYLTYEFTRSKDMCNGFAKREMGYTDVITIIWLNQKVGHEQDGPKR